MPDPTPHTPPALDALARTANAREAAERELDAAIARLVHAAAPREHKAAVLEAGRRFGLCVAAYRLEAARLARLRPAVLATEPEPA